MPSTALAGPLWSVVVPALLLIGSIVATWLLYRHFERATRAARRNNSSGSS